MSSAHVVIVDDEPRLLNTLRINLRTRGFVVTVADTGSEALRIVTSVRGLDVVVLDLGLPDIDGLSVLGRIRRVTDVPIIVLSARADSVDKITCLDAGADDYITKPFSMEEFLARLRAAIRRRGAEATTARSTAPVIETAAFTVDLINKQVTRHGAPVHLTPTEWAVLELLVNNEGKLVAQKDILTTIWGPTYLHNTNYLRVYLAGLRRKLESDPSHPQHLLTEAGMGYRFVRGAAASP